jgi:hypothetical protein
MQDDRIIEGTLLTMDNIMYSAPKASAQGAKSVNILNKKTKTYLTVSTPLMLTWGASEFIDEKTGEGDDKFSLSLQFPNSEYSSEDTRAFLENMKALEDKIKADALLYSKEWFGKVQKNAEVIDALWTPMLKYPKDKSTGDYDYSKQPTLKIKLSKWEGVWKTEIYDEDGGKLFPSQEVQVTPLDYLKKGTNIACLIQFSGIWFVNGKFSASWKLVQAVVQKPKASLQGTCFIKLKIADKEKLKKQEDPELHESHVGAIVDDSDEEEAAPVKVAEVVPPVQEEAVAAVAPLAPLAAEAEEVVAPKVKKVIKKKV